jgi:hypothetical protein
MLARKSVSAGERRPRAWGRTPEHPELGVLGVGGVEVELVAALPEERLAAGDGLDVVGVHAAAVEDGVLLLAEVLPDGPDDADSR